MSWSVDAIGKPAAVKAKLAEAFSKYPCQEPEETIRQQVGVTLGVALDSFNPDSAVKVNASGSQSTNGDKPISNTLNVKIEPLYGFVE